MLIRNLIGMAGAIGLYLVGSYVLHTLGIKGRDALVAIVAFNACFGVLGYFIFAGSILSRATLVFFVVIIYGIAMELIYPDPRHQLVQVFFAIPFGILAAGTTLVGGKLLKKLWRPRA